MKRGKAPTAAQQRWHRWLADQGCSIGYGSACIHHCAGAAAIHNKVHIGQWWVIPLSWEAHQGPGGIHGDLSLFRGHGLGECRKDIEKTIFRRLVAVYRRQRGEFPCPAEVLAAVEGFHR